LQRLKNPEAAAPWISDMLADALKSRSRSSNGFRASQTRERERELTKNRWGSEHLRHERQRAAKEKKGTDP
jgi:hypothetical protein